MKLSEYIISNKSKLINKFPKEILQIGENSFCFLVDRSCNENLFINLKKDNPTLFFYHLDRRIDRKDSRFIRQINKQLESAKVLDIIQINEDNIFRIEFLVLSLTQKRKMSLIIELFNLTPNLYLVDESDLILSSLFSYKNSINKVGKTYSPSKDKFKEKEIDNNYSSKSYFDLINEDLVNRQNILRKKLKTKLKSLDRKLLNIEGDHEKAKKNIQTASLMEYIFSSDYDIKKKYNTIEIEGSIITLDPKLTLLENVNHFYSLRKKANHEEKIYEEKKKRVYEEKNALLSDIEKINNLSLNEVIELERKYFPSKTGFETKETSKNSPFIVNYNGTIILFGKNIEQNDYLSFVYKSNRNFYWFHVKDYPSGHVLLKKEKPTEKEIVLASSISLITRKAKKGEVVYTLKKNVHRGHKKGEAKLKNYTTIKINEVEEWCEELFKNARRVDFH